MSSNSSYSVGDLQKDVNQKGTRPHPLADRSVVILIKTKTPSSTAPVLRLADGRNGACSSQRANTSFWLQRTYAAQSVHLHGEMLLMLYPEERAYLRLERML